MNTSLPRCAFRGRHQRVPGSLSRSLWRCSLLSEYLALALAVVGCLLVHAGWAAPCSYSITAPPGYSMIANQCDSTGPGGNTLNNVFPSVPAGSKIIKWNKVGQVFEPQAVFSGGVWSPNYTLNPGEGAFFYNPTASAITLNISGNAHTPMLPLVLPASGCCIASRQVPWSPVTWISWVWPHSLGMWCIVLIRPRPATWFIRLMSLTWSGSRRLRWPTWANPFGFAAEGLPHAVSRI